MSKHTPEPKHSPLPWRQGDQELDPMTVYDADWNPVASAVKGQGEDHFESLPRREQDTRRIVTCVNACAGLEDPAAAIEGARKALEQALKTNGGPINADETVDGKAYVMVEASAFEAMEQAFRTLTPSQEKKV